jgi:phage-related minor tail protein
MYVALIDGLEFIEEAQKVAARNQPATQAHANAIQTWKERERERERGREKEMPERDSNIHAH